MHDGRCADHDGDGHGLAQFLVFQPVLIAPGARQTRRHAHAEPVGGLQARAIGAHVLHEGLGVLGGAEGRGEIGRGVEARGRDRDR